MAATEKDQILEFMDIIKDGIYAKEKKMSKR